MQQEQLEKIQTLYKRHWEAFAQEMQSVIRTLTPEDEHQLKVAINAVIEESGGQKKVKGLGAVLAEQIDLIAPKIMVLADSQEKKHRLRDVLVKHLHEETREISEILLAGR